MEVLRTIIYYLCFVGNLSERMGELPNDFIRSYTSIFILFEQIVMIMGKSAYIFVNYTHYNGIIHVVIVIRAFIASSNAFLALGYRPEFVIALYGELRTIVENGWQINF